MIDHQEIRERFKPENIKVLFIAESPPQNDTFFYSEKSGFYTYTKQIFNELFEDEIKKADKFLHFFQNKGCFLDDLCHDPKPKNEILPNINFYIKELIWRLEEYKPQAVIITPLRIESFVRKAISFSNLVDTLKDEFISTLYFPGNSWQNEYMGSLWGVLHFLITKNILS